MRTRSASHDPSVLTDSHMTTLWQVGNTASAIALQPHPAVTASDCDAMLFDGRDKEHLFHLPHPQFLNDELGDVKRVCSVAPGVLLIDRSFFVDDWTLYYGVASGPQIVEVRSDKRWLVLINAIDFADEPLRSGVPCTLGGLRVPLFRIRGKDPTQLFCVTERMKGDRHGFKSIYEDVGLTGLVFQEIWSGDASELES